MFYCGYHSNEGGLPTSAGVTTVDFESRRKCENYISFCKVLKLFYCGFCHILVLVQNLNKAVQDILQHFGKVREKAEKVPVVCDHVKLLVFLVYI